MSSFIARRNGYDLSHEPPYSIEGCRMRLYFLKADRALLEHSLDHFLTGPVGRGELFTPIGNRVVAAFTTAEKVTGTDPSLGHMHEVDCGFFIPVFKKKKRGPDNYIIVDWGVFGPYMFVNNGWAAVTGREVHGFRKEVATAFSTSRDVGDPDWGNDPAFLDKIDGWGIKQRGANSRLEVLNFCTVSAQPLTDENVTVDDIIDALGDDDNPMTSDVRTTIKSKSTSATKMRIPVFFLRQFRNPRSRGMADVQEVVRAQFDIDWGTLRFKGLRGDIDIHLEDVASHPFEQDIGLSPGSHRSEFTVEASLDYVLS